MFVIGPMFNFSLENYLTIIGFFFICSSVIIIFFQVRINLRYNKRKAALDFCYSRIQNDLFPLISQLKVILKKEFFVFTKEESLSDLLKSDKLSEDEKKKVKTIVLDILNFYERMSIGIFKEVFDEDICYDDNGFNLIYFYDWVIPYVKEIQIKHKEERVFVNFEEIAERWKRYYSHTKAKRLARTAKSRKKSTIRNRDI